MKHSIVYKDFIGSVHYNSKIEEIEDLVTFEGKAMSELKKSFQAGVDEYFLSLKTTKATA